MSETKLQTLSGVPETSLVVLYLRAMESQRPDALIKNEKDVALVAQMSYHTAQVSQIPMVDGSEGKRPRREWEPGITCVKQACRRFHPREQHDAPDGLCRLHGGSH